MTTQSPKRVVNVCAAVVAFGIAAAAVPALADEGPQVPAIATAVVAEPCHAATADVAALLRESGPSTPAQAAGVCPAAAERPLGPAGFMARPPIRRYCVCGCGAGCETDADCGPGGRCVAFISCC